MAHFASKVKTNWSVKTTGIDREIDEVQRRFDRLLPGKWHELTKDEGSVLVDGSISSTPLHKVLCLREAIAGVENSAVRNLFRLLLVRTAVLEASNLRFAPEVSARGTKRDADVWSDWLLRVKAATDDLESYAKLAKVKTTVLHADSRSASKLANESIDFVFTSPPYPNEKDYTRTTRLESVLLGFITNKAQLRAVKKKLLRSNTRNIYKDDTDDDLIAGYKEIEHLAHEIERRRSSVGKESGFEKLYATVTKMYFGGMLKHFTGLKPKLKSDARLCYVVGDQASFLQVHIKTGEILADIAHKAGYRVRGIEMFRTRFSTATKADLREEVLILQNKPNPIHVVVNGRRQTKHIESDIPKAEMSRYDKLIVFVFERGLSTGGRKSSFSRDDMEEAAKDLGMPLPKNLGDVLYTYRYRAKLPKAIRDHAPKGEEWVIRSIGRGKYEFELTTIGSFYANPLLSDEEIVDETPPIMKRFAVSDQQLLLATIRFNKLISRFTDTPSELLGGHFRSMIKGTGQVTTDEIYVGENGDAVYCFPVQARGHKEALSVVQIEQDMKMCADRFPNTTCRPIGAQWLNQDTVALLEFTVQENGIRLKNEKHYRLASAGAKKPKGR